MENKDLYIAERILRFTVEDEQSGGCTLTKAQAKLLVDEMDRLDAECWKLRGEVATLRDAK